MNKILVSVVIPILEKEYEIFIPKNRRVSNVIKMIIKGVSDENYMPKYFPKLYNKETGKIYGYDQIIQDTDIENATKLILI